MSPVDRAWLQMDRPANPMVIVVLMVLRSRLRPERLRRLLAERFLRFHRFRCIPVNDPIGARWVEASQFELSDHVQCVALAGAMGQHELEALVGELASTPLKPTRPWWSFHLVERYGSGSALIVRIHHCYADGVALLNVLLTLSDEAESAAGSEHAASAKSGVQQLLERAAKLLESGLHYGLHPLEGAALLRLGANLAGELAGLGLMDDDPPTRLRGTPSGVKRAAWAPSLALEEVKTIGRVLGCTINDVLISVLAGALGSYLEAQGDAVTGLTLRATVPLNLRSSSSASPELGNHFGLVFVELPVGIRHPLERLYAVHAAMCRLKSSPQALVTFGLLTSVGSLPTVVEESAIALLSAKASLVASNLPGPNQPLHLAGAAVSELLFWVPQTGSIGVGVSILTYCGRVQLGVIADRGLIPDPRALVDAMATEFNRLVFLVLLGAGALGD
jgi:diacylglycerol O-acyltransferase / wax synthase